MKKILSLLLIAVFLLSFFSCGNSSTYEPVESSEEESRVLMTFEMDGVTYEVKYELYRALFLNHASDYADRGENFFLTDEGIAAADKIKQTVIELCADIYATIHLSKKLGLDVFSGETDSNVLDLIADDVNNEYYNGDYEKYLSDLSAINLNYSVQDLMLRYQLAYDNIIDYYQGNFDIDNPTADMKEGALEYTKDDVREFYNSDKCVRISIVTINHELPLAEVESIRNTIASKPTESAALSYAMSCTLSDPADIFNGVIIGSESVDYVFYRDVLSEAFSLDLYETSEVIEISSDVQAEYWVLYKTDKNDEHYNECYSDVENAYISQRIGEIISDVTEQLSASAKETDIFKSLKHSDIRMQ